MWCDVMCCNVYICVQVDASIYEEKSQVSDSDWTNTRQNESLRKFFFEVYISALQQLITSQPPLLLGNIHLWVISSVSFLLLRYLISAPSSQSSSVSQFFSQNVLTVTLNLIFAKPIGSTIRTQSIPIFFFVLYSSEMRSSQENQLLSASASLRSIGTLTSHPTPPQPPWST